MRSFFVMCIKNQGKFDVSDELFSKFGEDAALYADVRSEAAAAAGDESSSRRWADVAHQLEDDVADRLEE